MRRAHLLELHEQPWFPATCRSMFQRGLGHMQCQLGIYDEATPMLAELVRRVGADRILDLCSGSAEVPVSMARKLREIEGLDVRVQLSDLYPNLAELERLARQFPGAIEYSPTPVDATRPAAASDGTEVRTMFAALHHFRPGTVREILASAARDAAGVAIFESTGRTFAHMVQTPMLPVASALVCGFRLRPWRPEHLLWTLGLPLVPLAAWFDGVVSNLRTYTPDELLEIVGTIDSPGFRWEAGTLPVSRVPVRITYLTGWRER